MNEGKVTMRFYEYETWKLKEGVNIEEYDQMLRDWFQFLHAHKEELFQEWISAKYYKEPANKKSSLN